MVVALVRSTFVNFLHRINREMNNKFHQKTRSAESIGDLHLRRNPREVRVANGQKHTEIIYIVLQISVRLF